MAAALLPAAAVLGMLAVLAVATAGPVPVIGPSTLGRHLGHPSTSPSATAGPGRYRDPLRGHRAQADTGLVLATLLPDSSVGLFLLLDLDALWVQSVPQRVDLVLAVAMLDVLALHLALTLSAAGPPGAVLPRSLLRSLLRTWLLRGLALAGTGLLAWLAARLAAGTPTGPTAWAMAAGLGLVRAWGGGADGPAGRARPGGSVGSAPWSRRSTSRRCCPWSSGFRPAG